MIWLEMGRDLTTRRHCTVCWHRWLQTESLLSKAGLGSSMRYSARAEAAAQLYELWCELSSLWVCISVLKLEFASEQPFFRTSSWWTWTLSSWDKIWQEKVGAKLSWGLLATTERKQSPFNSLLAFVSIIGLHSMRNESRKLHTLLWIVFFSF